MVMPPTWAFSLLLLVCFAAVTTSGCKKSGDTAEGASKVIALTDVNPDGTINEQGMQKIEKEAAGAPSVTVEFVRVRISDAGLAQLAKFPNLRRVEAGGSPLSQGAIDKLKAAIPEVEVLK
jgi:hypothetical protein